MRVDRAVRWRAVVLAVLLTAIGPASAAVAAGPTGPGAYRPVVTPSGPTPGDENQPEPLTEAERAAVLAEPAIVVIEVRWEGYVHDRVSREMLDTEKVSASTWCTGVGVGHDGYLLTTRSCLDQSAVAVEAFRQVVDRRVADGRTPESESEDLLAELLLGATIGADPDDPPERSVHVRRAVTDDEPMSASVVLAADPAKGDAALIKIARGNQPVLPLANDADLTLGSDLVTVECLPPAVGPAKTGGSTSSPDDDPDSPVRPTFRTGTVVDTSPRVLVDQTEHGAALPAGVVLTHDAAIAGLIDASLPTGDRLVDLATIRNLLAEADVDTELGEVDRDYRAGLDAYYAGRYGDAIERFDAVLAIIPAHVQAHQYRAEAQSRRDADGGEVPAPTEEVVDRVESWLGGRSWILVGLVVLVAIAVFLLHRRRPPGSDPAAPDADAADPGTGGSAADTVTPTDVETSKRARQSRR